MWAAFALIFVIALPSLGQIRLRDASEYSKSLAPFVPSPQPVVDRMLELADLKPGQRVYDLGCGDGRILITAAQRFRVFAVGVELSERLVQMARIKVRDAKLDDRVTVIQGDLLNVNLDPADAVILYLETGSNDKIRPNLEKSLRPGAKVISHDFHIRGWKPIKEETIESFNRRHKIFVYQMPAKQR